MRLDAARIPVFAGAALLGLLAGPLYAYLHFFLSPLTTMQPPAIRFVNAGCLAVTIAATCLAMRRTGQDAALSRAAMLLAVPMVWTTSGLALTELSALALASLAVLAVTAALPTKSTGCH